MTNVALSQPEAFIRILGDDDTGWPINRVIEANLASVGSVSEAIQAYCLSLSNPDSAVPLLGPDMNLVLSELLTNIVKHAYGGSASGNIEIRARFLGQYLEVLIVDQGSELPKGVLEKCSVEFDGDDLFALPEGGFGWSIVHSIIDEIEYQRADDSNRLLLRKNIFYNLEG